MSQFLLEGFEPRVVVVTTDSKALPDPECSEPSRAGPGGAFHRADFDAPRAISRTCTIAPVGWCLPSGHYSEFRR